MAQLNDYLDEVDHPAIKGMYDTFHANIEEADPIKAIRTISPNMIHFHVSENDRGTPGKGHVPWAETYKTLKKVKYDGWLTIEAFGRSLPAIAAATKSGAISSEPGERLQGWHQAYPQELERRMTIDLAKLVDTVAARIIAHAEELTALDSAIGDADHGLNMKRGFEQVLADKTNNLAKPLPDALKALGMTLVMKVGGASGPLYGTLFMTLGKELSAIRK